MGRLQRYLRRLTEKEWNTLHQAAQRELHGVKMLTLLQRLRKTGIPQTLTPSEKELAKRLERWIWKRAYIAEQEAHPIYLPAPAEWQNKGALLYHKKGLSDEGLALLKQIPQHPSQHLATLSLKLRLQLERGSNREAYATLKQIERFAKNLRTSVERSQLQLIIDRLLREYGGSYTEIGQRFLRRLERHPYWKQPLSSAGEELSADVNLHVIYALARGRPEEAHQICLHAEVRDHPSILLNRWMCSLLLRHTTQKYLLYGSLFSQNLSEYQKAILLNRLLLTILLYGPPQFVEDRLPLLEKWYVHSVSLPENQYVWAQLLWLVGRKAEAASTLEALLARVKKKPFAYLQGALILLLVYTDAHAWHKAVRHLRHFLPWLHKAERVIASAAILSELIRRLYEARLRPQVLSSVAESWQRHLTAYPTERYFWDITLLPDWIASQLSHRSLYAYRLAQAKNHPTDLDTLLDQAAKGFT